MEHDIDLESLGFIMVLYISSEIFQFFIFIKTDINSTCINQNSAS